MPRKSRIDAPGTLHHIIARGIDRNNIFKDDIDRENFIERLGTLLQETRTDCFAWALIPNHFHLLIRTGANSISMLMRRLLTGHAAFYNRRHHRLGHLFQNRYKSILCQADRYLLELVRYIHLNPLRAEIVNDSDSLEQYPYCGHGEILKRGKYLWQNTEYVLGLFAKGISTARRRYRDFVLEGISRGRRPELVGGGLLRSLGGWSAVKSFRKSGTYMKGDERILGDSDFVESVLGYAQENFERKYRLAADGYDFLKVIDRVAELMNLNRDDLLSSNRSKKSVAARSVACYWAMREIGISQCVLARKFDISQPAVSIAVKRGEKLINRYMFTLFDK